MEDDDGMPAVPRARAGFIALTETEVWEALYVDPEGETPITAEVTRLVAAYTVSFRDCVSSYGKVPPEILHVQARWPIERVAVRVLVRLLETEGDVGMVPGRLTRH